MAHKCFISYKKEDREYRDSLVRLMNQSDIIDKSLDYVIKSEDGDYICYKIRQDYLKDSTVTIFLIGEHSKEDDGKDYLGRDNNFFIKWELQASLYNGFRNTRNGMLGIVLPSMYDKVYKGSYNCSVCGKQHNYVDINDDTTIREFSCNYYTQPHNGCAYSEDERYCVLVRWDEFIKNPEEYIEQAYAKREAPIREKVRVRNLR